MLARSAVINRGTVIGQGTSIGDGTTVTNTVLGRRCRIGNNVLLDGAYIWDDVVVGDGTVIQCAILANEAVVGDQCRVEPGVLLSYGVKIANGMTIPKNTRITKSGCAGMPSDAKVVGEGGEGNKFVREENYDETDNESVISSGLSGFKCHENVTRHFC
jgi:translation initiation factor eIF-2B subunit epsilon